jgi:hypothetical protein
MLVSAFVVTTLLLTATAFVAVRLHARRQPGWQVFGSLLPLALVVTGLLSLLPSGA